ADVKAVMQTAGSALMGVGRASGEGRAVEAARNAINSPLLESTIDGASGVIFSVTGGPDLTLHEVQEAANVIYQSVSEDANIIFGAVLDDRLHGEVLITVIATGFDMVVHPAEHALVRPVERTREQVQRRPEPAQAHVPVQQQQHQQIQPSLLEAPVGEEVSITTLESTEEEDGPSEEMKKIASDILDIPEFLRARNR
ncbi:MAG TPA: cell division protein FtsZ, partial [Candidatus Melainabacteria bacterium]|nr:cell division protein FtsZ [Candidatus Melainabacteria bacterium]